MDITSLLCKQTSMSYSCGDVTCVFECQQPFASPPMGAFGQVSFTVCCNVPL